MKTPAREKAETECTGFAVDGWIYADEKQMPFALTCLLQGISLPLLDEFIDSLPDGPGQDELLQWRNDAFDLFHSGNRKALYWCLQAIWCNWKSRLTIDGARPYLACGFNVKSGQKSGHEAVHGTKAEKQTRWTEYQAALDKILLRPDNHLSLTDARKLVAAKHGISHKTVERHTKDPRPKVVSPS